MSSTLTAASLEVFLLYADDAPNWSGTPWVSEGNIQTDKQMRGNLSDLVKKGLIQIRGMGGSQYIVFTEAGKTLASQHGMSII